MLEPDTVPGFIDKNLATLDEVASYSIRGLSALLLKPTAQKEHGGGMQIAPGSAEYEALSELIHRMHEPERCAPLPTARRFSGLVLLSPASTLYKASLRIAGRLPTEAEMSAVASGGEGELGAALDRMMAEPGFAEAVAGFYQDEHQFSPEDVSEEDFPAILTYGAGDALQGVMQAVGREPLDIIAYVVRENRPFTEILTADYTVVSPLLADVYGVRDQVAFEDPSNASALAPVKLAVVRGGGDVPIPHAGVLTTPSFLGLYDAGARQRRRAGAVFRRFLATDLSLTGASSLVPLDLTWMGADVNPAMNNADCTACHSALDEVAGTFMNWTRSGSYMPPAKGWYQDMPPPGFGGEQVPQADLGRSHQVLAHALVKDDRFAWATARTAFRALTGRDPLPYPSDPDGSTFGARLAAWTTQDMFFRTATRAFAEGGYNYKTLVRSIVLSPYFRAADVGEGGAGENAIAGLGTMRLLPPDLLSKKLFAVTGVNPWGSRIVEEYHLHYALGASGLKHAVRSAEERQSGLMAVITERIAHDTACFAVAADFTRSAEERLLFPHVNVHDAPEIEDGQPAPSSVAAIRQNIRYLHGRLYGETPAEGDLEVERTFRLFVDTWREGSEALATQEEPEILPWHCQSRHAVPEIPDDRDISTDPRFTIRAWMAVLKAMLSDPSFLAD